MASVSEIFQILNAEYPVSLAEEWDNAGFLIGRGSAEVKKIMLALDITEKVAEEACDEGCNLIISHHPVIFSPRKAVTDGDVYGKIILSLIENGISAICMHTNLDSARNGVNDALAEALGVMNARPIETDDGVCGIGRYGELEKELELGEFLRLVCARLGCEGLKYHNAGRNVKKIAVGGGSCGDYIDKVFLLGCDTFVTSDIKHNRFLEAEALGINIIDAGHFETEDVVIKKIYGLLSERLPGTEITVAENDTACTSFFTV